MITDVTSVMCLVQYKVYTSAAASHSIMVWCKIFTFNHGLCDWRIIHFKIYNMVVRIEFYLLIGTGVQSVHMYLMCACSMYLLSIND